MNLSSLQVVLRLWILRLDALPPSHSVCVCVLKISDTHKMIANTNMREIECWQNLKNTKKKSLHKWASALPRLDLDIIPLFLNRQQTIEP